MGVKEELVSSTTTVYVNPKWEAKKGSWIKLIRVVVKAKESSLKMSFSEGMMMITKMSIKQIFMLHDISSMHFIMAAVVAAAAPV